MEKAWAKLHGDYVKIVQGLSHNTFRDLTGAPSFMHMTQDTENVWSILINAQKKQHMMACGVMSETQEDIDRLADENLLNGHAYSVLKCATVVGSDDNRYNIVQIRNPWGSFEWHGDWGDSSDLWTESARRKMNQVNDLNDGLFCMKVEDFIDRFSLLFVCNYVDHYLFSSRPAPINEQGRWLFRVEVNSSGEYTFGFSQKSKRTFPLTATYEYSDVTMSLMK